MLLAGGSPWAISCALQFFQAGPVGKGQREAKQAWGAGWRYLWAGPERLLFKFLLLLRESDSRNPGQCTDVMYRELRGRKAADGPLRVSAQSRCLLLEGRDFLSCTSLSFLECKTETTLTGRGAGRIRLVARGEKGKLCKGKEVLPTKQRSPRAALSVGQIQPFALVDCMKIC